MQAGRPRVRLLIVVWGDRYIDMCATYTVSALLAPGNLPALAEACDVEALIMTAERDIPAFRRNRRFQALERQCAVNFVTIDDLILDGSNTLYGITLTLAFARGIMTQGVHQTSTFFLFMNADFVVADGALRGLLPKILDGEPAVVAPSVRVIAETVQPILDAALDGDVLAIPPRRMVAAALQNLHPTVRGKVVTQDDLCCITLNQLFWSVDDETMIGHFPLMFMLCIKPERPLRGVSYFCDYGFIPDLVPSGRMVCLDDSDDFFMLELGAEKQEEQYMRDEPITRGAILESWRDWTTVHHRRMGLFSLVMHAGERPSTLEATQREALAFVQELQDELPQPCDHSNHYYWVQGLEAWRFLRDQARGSRWLRMPPETAPRTLLELRKRRVKSWLTAMFPPVKRWLA